MIKRPFISIGLGLILATTAIALPASRPAIATSPAARIQAGTAEGKRALNIAQFKTAIASITPARVAELDSALTLAMIPDMQMLFQHSKLTSEELVKYYLWRIKRYDVDKLNSVTELNPDALEIARQLDVERAAGKVRGPLHGTAVLLKDVIGTGDKLHNTAGAEVLRNARSDRDAFIVKRLRDAGVIVLGKTAMTEWHNFIAYKQVNGYSTLGGQVVNPYNKKTDPWGSSTGSSVAVVSNFATFALGAESFGSLIMPGVANGAATLKPSMGLVSRDRLIPNMDSQDVPGPLARNTTDLALVMDVLVATDQNDPITIAASTAPKGFAQKLDATALRGLRIGLLPAAGPEDEAITQHIADLLTQAGAQVVPLSKQPDLVPDIFTELDPINAYGFRHGVEKYLAETHAPVKTIQEIVDFNAQNPKVRVKYGQEYLVMAAETPMTSDEYAKLTQASGDKARKHIDGLIAGNKLDLIAGVQFAAVFTVYYAGAGYPAAAITVGYQPSGEPIGLVLTGKLFDDAKLLRAAYALEQANKVWRAPKLK